MAGFETGAAARAFQSLPERWQLVLWHLEVEGQKPADIAPLLGISANSVSALAYRAREGLRQAFVSMHAQDADDERLRRDPRAARRLHPQRHLQARRRGRRGAPARLPRVRRHLPRAGRGQLRPPRADRPAGPGRCRGGVPLRRRGHDRGGWRRPARDDHRLRRRQPSPSRSRVPPLPSVAVAGVVVGVTAMGGAGGHDTAREAPVSAASRRQAGAPRPGRGRQAGEVREAGNVQAPDEADRHDGRTDSRGHDRRRPTHAGPDRQ